MAINLSYRKFDDVIFDVIIIFCHIFIGTFASCFILEYTQSYKVAYAVISGFTCLSCFLVDLLAEEHSISSPMQQREFFVALLAVAMGMLTHWSSKLGYTVAFMTSNGQKFSESLFRKCFNYHQGGAKLTGDMVIILVILSTFFAGAIAGAYTTELIGDYWSLTPITASYPLHLWLSGCIQIDCTSKFKQLCCPIRDEEDDGDGEENANLQAVESSGHELDCPAESESLRVGTVLPTDSNRGDDCDLPEVAADCGHGDVEMGAASGRVIGTSPPGTPHRPGIERNLSKRGRQSSKWFSVGHLSTKEVNELTRDAELRAMLGSSEELGE